MTVHTVITRIAAAGEQPELIPEAEDGPLADAIRRVILHLDNTSDADHNGRLTVFVHIWSGELTIDHRDLYRFVGDPAHCLSDLHRQWPEIVDKCRTNNTNSCATKLENNSKEMAKIYSLNGYDPLDWIAT